LHRKLKSFFGLHAKASALQPAHTNLSRTMISPFGNITVLPEAMWHPEDTQRGTFGILSSCLITMSLCIWTAVHLNLPEHKKDSQQIYRRFMWLALGLFAPEVVVWSAWRQKMEMKALSYHMEQRSLMAKKPKTCARIRDWLQRASAKKPPTLGAERESESGADVRDELYRHRAHPWTDVHSWYVVMGGFAFEDTSSELQFMPGDRQRMTLASDAVRWLAESRVLSLPDISRRSIEDKSKSGGLGKFLTIWQATYFCVQCVFRLSQQY
jgi:hypothetical protein